MIRIIAGDKLLSMSEILDNVRDDMRLHDVTDEANIAQVAAILAVGLNESVDFIRGALRKR